MRTPAHGEAASQAIKDQICEMALGLLEEQVQARIVHYKADLETNPELDAITAEVVAQLKQIQAQAQAAAAHGIAARGAVRESHEKILRALLERVFPVSAPSLLVEKRLKGIHRKLARLFFQSELHEKTRGKDGAIKTIQHGEQAIFYLLARYENRLKNGLGSFDYASAECKSAPPSSSRRSARTCRTPSCRGDRASSSASSRRSTACWWTSSASSSRRRRRSWRARSSSRRRRSEGRAFAYKITADAFPRFRAAFERRLMVRLVGFAEDQLLARLADTAGIDREETVQFITDPRVFSMILGEICEGLYEFLCNEGFLDLPTDWRSS